MKGNTKQTMLTIGDRLLADIQKGCCAGTTAFLCTGCKLIDG